MKDKAPSVETVLRYLRDVGSEMTSSKGTGLSVKIAEATGMKLRTVNWALRQLEEASWIERDIRGRRTYAIRLLPAAGGQPSEEMDARDPAESATRRRIIRAATQLFQAHGYHGASMRSIGAAAGVTGPALYHYFKTKQDVLAAAFFDLGDRMFADLHAVLSSKSPPPEPLEELIRSYIDVIVENRDAFPLVFSEFRNLTGSDQEKSSRRRDDLLRLWGVLVNTARPDLNQADAEMLALGTVWIIHSIGFVDVPVDEDRAKQMLFRMAMTCILETDVGEISDVPSQ